MQKIEFDTKIGKVIAIADGGFLISLEFLNRKSFDKQLSRVCENLVEDTDKKNSLILELVQKQINEYLAGKRKIFDLPIKTTGTDFQKIVWNKLLKIPYGQTISYKELACNSGKETAYRAVANANAANSLSIIIPCHRVIQNDGGLGGYAGGLEVKKHLLNLESQY